MNFLRGLFSKRLDYFEVKQRHIRDGTVGVDIGKATVVWCENIENLKTLPEWPGVVDVYISNCNLDQLPLWPKVRLVSLRDVYGITTLPLWTSVEDVRIFGWGWHHGINELPLWPNVTTVVCTATNVQTLPKWPKVKRVECMSNEFLTTLPEWPSVEYVNCMMCPRLKELPAWGLDVKVVSSVTLKYKDTWKVPTFEDVKAMGEGNVCSTCTVPLDQNPVLNEDDPNNPKLDLTLEDNLKKLWEHPAGKTNHIFHRECIDPWYIGLRKGKCPLCKQPGFGKKKEKRKKKGPKTSKRRRPRKSRRRSRRGSKRRRSIRRASLT